VAFPADKMEAVVEALKPILGYQQARASVAGDDQAPLLADLPGAGTACTRTSAQGSEDWSSTDAVAFE